MKILLGLMLLLAQISYAGYLKSDHYDGKKFFNPEKNQLHSLWDVIKWKVSTDKADWPEHVPNKSYTLPLLTQPNKAVVTFINHASFLVQIPSLNILTDPIFSKRASPYSFLGPKRVREPGVKFEELPKIDVVLISHNHYDHLDTHSLKELDGKFHPLFLVPLGNEKLLKEAGIQNVKEMDWWEDLKIQDVVIHFAPAQHWSARGLFDQCETLWGSYMVMSPNFKLYFAGDSGLSGHFTQIRNRLGTPDVSLLPIGSYEPRYFMKVNHMNPNESVKAHLDLGSALSIGMHFGTFQLTDESMTDPQKKLETARRKYGVESDDFITLDQGESKIFN